MSISTLRVAMLGSGQVRLTLSRVNILGHLQR